jgi:hypothetical protein
MTSKFYHNTVASATNGASYITQIRVIIDIILDFLCIGLHGTRTPRWVGASECRLSCIV